MQDQPQNFNLDALVTAIRQVQDQLAAHVGKAVNISLTLRNWLIGAYIQEYKQNMMADGDNPPVGLLLCTGKDHALVEYALAGMDNQMFVSKYQLELPSEEVIRKFLEENA